jgi:hypothetical protein
LKVRLERKGDIRLAVRIGSHIGPVVNGEMGVVGGRNIELLGIHPTSHHAFRDGPHLIQW